MKRDNGSATVELVLLAPVLMLLVLFGVYAGRGAQATNQVQHAADQGARAASIVRPSRMPIVGRQFVLNDMESSGLGCVDPLINVAFDDDSRVHTVLVEVECVVNTVGLNILGLTQRTVYAKSIEVIDRWRFD